MCVCQDIDPEMVEVHRFVVDKYSQKFPELDSLIPQPVDYVRTVQVMRNEMVSSTVGFACFIGGGGETGKGVETYYHNTSYDNSQHHKITLP